MRRTVLVALAVCAPALAHDSNWSGLGDALMGIIVAYGVAVLLVGAFVQFGGSFLASVFFFEIWPGPHEISVKRELRAAAAFAVPGALVSVGFVAPVASWQFENQVGAGIVSLAALHGVGLLAAIATAYRRSRGSVYPVAG